MSTHEQIEQEILAQIQQTESLTRDASLLRPGDRELRLFGIGQRIAELLKQYIGQIDADAAVLIAKKVFDKLRPQIPDMFENILWVVVEFIVRRMFERAEGTTPTVLS